jgi:nucleoside phosphorylase
MILVLAAMQSEVVACFGGNPPPPTNEIAGDPIIESGPVAVFRTGMGPRSAAAAEAALDRYRPDAALSVGVAGGLLPGIGIGDLVVCTHVDHESHRHSDEEMSVYCDTALIAEALAAATEAGVTASEGASLTVDEAAWGPADKAAHHAWKKHEIVEMESFWIGRAAVKRGVPFLAARTVSDTSGDTLPNIGAMRPDGTFDQARFLAYLREHPETGDQLSAVAQNSRIALANLGRFLETLLPRLVAPNGVEARS